MFPLSMYTYYRRVTGNILTNIFSLFTTLDLDTPELTQSSSVTGTVVTRYKCHQHLIILSGNPGAM